MSKCSKVEDKEIKDSGSKVGSSHPTESEANPQVAKREQTFRIKQIILSRLRVEFPLHDVADLGMVVQRMWQDIETDTEAKPKSRIITRG
jgi:hypothetical protein